MYIFIDKCKPTVMKSSKKEAHVGLYVSANVHTYGFVGFKHLTSDLRVGG